MNKKFVVAVLLAVVAPALYAAPLATKRHPNLRPRLQDAPGEEWLQFDDVPGNPSNLDEQQQESRIIVPDFDHLDVMWQTQLPESVDGSPAFANINTLLGRRDVIFVTTRQGRLMAILANSGSVMWQTEPPPGPRWTTSSPAVDPGKELVYSYALDGYIHKYDINTGVELTGDGWPQLVTLKGSVEKGSSALTIATTRAGKSFLYMTTAGYPEPSEDFDYQGHLVTVDLATGEQNIFNAACSDKVMHFVHNGDESNDCSHVQSGIWGRQAATYDPETDRLFVTTSDGDYDANEGGFNWGDSIVALRPDGSHDGGTPLDSYTPANFQFMQTFDLDFGSCAVVILPLAPGSHLPRLGLQAGKDSMLRLVDLANLSGQGRPRNIGGELSMIRVPQGGDVLAKPATWLADDGATWVVVATYRGISGLALVVDENGTPQLEPRWQSSDDSATPVIIDGRVYQARNHEVVVRNVQTGERIWSNSSIGSIHWQSPIVVNGRVYVCDNEGRLFAFGARP